MELREMLKEEIRKSEKYAETHYGQMCGEDYPEMCEELTKSSSINQLLLMGIIRCIAGITKVQKYVTEHPVPETRRDLAEFVKGQIVNGSIQPFLDMFYWGMKIGARREREEMEALKGVERASVNIDNREGDVKMTDADKNAIDELLKEANALECPLCHKAIGPDDVCEMVGGPHVLCDDPKLTKHHKLDRSMAGGGRQIGYIDDNGKERWL